MEQFQTENYKLRKSSTFTQEGAEKLVLSSLLIRDIECYQAYENQKSYDLIAISKNGKKIAKIEETNRHTIKDILEEALEHELHALSLYKKLLASVADASIYLEEYARGLIGEEEQHSLELKAMLKDFGSI